MENPLRTLARFAAGLCADDLPPEILHAAALRILDNVSAALGAARESRIERIAEAYRSVARKEDGSGVWGQGFRAPVPAAAFLNAMMCHALESDDVHSASKAHIGAVVIPAAWSVAEWRRCSGRELLAAVTAGYEVEARIGMALGVKAHRALGWHVTATAGVFGAAAACGRLMGLDEDRMLSCLALAGSQSFGTWAFLSKGCDSKILNPARAAASGCDAAILAAAGLTGPETILSAEDGGLLHMMSTEPNPEILTAGLGSVWEITRVDSKPYPCCRSTHCAIDGILSLRKALSFRAEDVDSIRILSYRIGVQQCAATPASLHPTTPPEASFSTPYCVAAALLRGKVTLEEFRPEAIADPDVRSMMDRVEVLEDERFTAAYPAHWGCLVRLTLHDGSVLEEETPDAAGGSSRPLTEEQALERAAGMIARALPGQAERLAGKLLRLDTFSALPELCALDIRSPVCNH